MPDFQNAYKAKGILYAKNPLEIYEDFNCQLVKLIEAMCSGEYSKEDAADHGIRPTLFRRVAGKGHPEFSTAKQQDAEVS